MLGKLPRRKKNQSQVCLSYYPFQKVQKRIPFLSLDAPSVCQGYRCFTYTQVLGENIRKQISDGSPEFKKVYDLCSGSERIFSRLLNLCMQNPSVRGLKAVFNYCTVVHIAVLLIALTTAKTRNKDKIRLVKFFLLNI